MLGVDKYVNVWVNSHFGLIVMWYSSKLFGFVCQIKSQHFFTMENFLLPKQNDQQFSIIRLMVAQFLQLT